MTTVNSKMTAIADEIRTLTNTTEAMGLDAMATNINNANTATTTQEDLISQIQAALISKAGGSGSGSYETCTVTITGAKVGIAGISYTKVENGILTAGTGTESGTFNNVLCGSLMFIQGSYLEASAINGVVYHVSGRGCQYLAPTAAGSTDTLTLIQD